MNSEGRNELRFPRWIEESGLPERLQVEAPPHGWTVFRRLVEYDIETNLIPRSCTLNLERLSRHCGLKLNDTAHTLDQLQTAEVIRVLETSPPNVCYEICIPLPVPESVAVIRQRLAESGIDASRMYLRYAQAIDYGDKHRRTIELYQALYGLRFTAKTAETLERIAVQCSTSEILQAFSDAFQAGGKSLSWIKKKLKVN